MKEEDDAVTLALKSRPAQAVAVMALAHLTIESCHQFLPVVYPLLRQRLDLSYAQIGTLALGLAVTTSLAQPLFGYISDRWSPAPMVFGGLIWVGLSMSLVGFTWSYASLFMLILVGSLGSAIFHPPAASLTLANGGLRKGTAVSFFSIGGVLGSGISPLLMTGAMGWFGLRGTGVLAPLVLVVGGTLAYLFSRLPAGSGTTTTPVIGARGANFGLGLGLIVLAVMARSWFHLSMTTYLPAWAQSQGWDVVYGGRLLFLFAMGAGLGGLTGGPLSDRVGRWQVLAASLLLLSLVQFFFLSATGLTQMGLVALMGFLVGGTMPVSIVMAQEAWPQGVGLASSMVMGVGWMPGGIGAWVTGWVADHYSLAAGMHTLLYPPLLGLICVLAYAALTQRAQITG